jgi:hypothetical protein
MPQENVDVKHLVTWVQNLGLVVAQRRTFETIWVRPLASVLEISGGRRRAAGDNLLKFTHVSTRWIACRYTKLRIKDNFPLSSSCSPKHVHNVSR